MRRLNQIAILIAGALTAQGVAAENISERARFILWNECRPMTLGIDIRYANGKIDGLSKKEIEIVVRDKLRANRLYREKRESGTATGVLYISLTGNLKQKIIGNMEVISGALSITVQFYKKVFDSATKLERLAATYTNSVPYGIHGMHEDQLASIAPSVEKTVVVVVDDFIGNYLRVNADACKNSN